MLEPTTDSIITIDTIESATETTDWIRRGRFLRGWARGSVLAVLTVLALIILSTAYCLYNPNTLKPLAAFLSERFLDRTLAIDGNLTLELSMQPRVSGKGVRFGNAPGASAPYMATAEYALVQIDLSQLFENRVHLLDLDVHGAELNLEDRVNGRPNWRFFDPDENEDSGSNWSFMIEGLNVTDGRINATVGELRPVTLTIPELTEASDPEGFLHLDGHGQLNDSPWRLHGRIGTFAELLIAGQLDMDLEIMLDDVEVSASGSIGELASLTGVDLAMTIYGPDADLLGEIFRMPDAFREDIALNASIRPDGGSHSVSIDGHVSTFEIQTAGIIADLGNLNGWDGSATVRGPDAGVFGKALQIEGFPDGPFQISGTLHLHGGDLDLKEVTITTEDVELTLNADFADFPRREDAFGNLQLSGPDVSQLSTLLKLSGLPTEPFELSLSLDAGNGEVLTSSFRMGTHTLVAAGSVGEFPDFHGTRLTFETSGADIDEILAITGERSMLVGAYQTQGQLALDAEGLRLTEIDLHSGPFHFTGSQYWEDLSHPAHFDLQGTLEVSNLAEAAAPYTDQSLPDVPLSVQADIRAHAEGVELRSSQIRLRSIKATASGELGKLPDIAGLELNISIDGPHVGLLIDDAVPDNASKVPFSVRSQVSGTDQGIEIRSFELETQGGTFGVDGFIALTDGNIGSHLNLAGSGGSLAALIPNFPTYQPPDLPWQINGDIAFPQPDHFTITDGSLNIGSVQMTASGVLDTADYTQTSLKLRAHGDRITDIGQIGDLPWPDHEFDIATELEGTSNAIKIKHLIARWGDSDIEGSGSVNLSGKPVINIKGVSQVLNIIDLQSALFGDPEDLEPEDDDAKFFADTPISIDYLAEFDANLDIQVDHFHGRSARLSDVNLALDVIDGELLLERASYRDDIGYFDAKGFLRPDGDRIYLELALTGEEAGFRFLTGEDQPAETIPRYTLDVDISGTGRTVADLAGNLNGTLLISSDGGMINNSQLDAFAGDFMSNVLEVLNPFVASEEVTPMKCMVLNAAIRDGQLALAPGFVMRTDRLNMFVYGGVDLKTERLDLSLATQARRGIGISAASITNPYFKIGGTLAAPALQLDPASAAVAASVATATAGLSILIRGVWDRLMGAQNPCPRFLEYEQKPTDASP